MSQRTESASRLLSRDEGSASRDHSNPPALCEDVRVTPATGAPSPVDGNVGVQRQSLNVVGLGLHLPRQRKRPRGTVERFGSRPENWRGLYYVYVMEDGIEKRAQRRPVLGPTASMSKRSAEDKLAEVIERELAIPPERSRTIVISRHLGSVPLPQVGCLGKG
jgi:hypothetical protein